jgi:hypothetical protein
MASQLGTFAKYMRVLETFEKKLDHTLTSYDEELQSEIGISQKQLDRILEELTNSFDSIVVEKVGKRKAYKMLKPIDIFVEAFSTTNEIGWFFNMAHDADPEIFKELAQYTNPQKHLYKFFNTPFEDMATLEGKISFKRLKNAVELHEYRDIKFYDNNTIYKNLKCIKLLFMDNNWYIAYVDEADTLKFGRISFIEEVSYSKGKNTFQPHSVEKHLEFIESSLQNSMTLYGVKIKTATIQAKPKIAKYFKEGMKKFLSTQTFKKELEDGSVLFTLNYTQELEVLPFIQKWLPDLIILEPQELKEHYTRKLQQSLNNLSKY